MLIVDLVPYGGGWDPINHMVALAAELFESPVVRIESDRPALATRILATIHPRRRGGEGPENCLLVCRSPTDLLYLFEIPRWRKRFRFVAAWIIDSFWLEWIPRAIKLAPQLDHLFVTSGEDVDEWNRAVRIPTTWLPWGTDALRLGSGAADRAWDLTRIGRQPGRWDDDADTARQAASQGLRFHARPAVARDPWQNQRALAELYGQSRFVLAFSNLKNPSHYTHPTRQYLTGRWVDALGGGAVVAGCAPTGPAIDSLLWPGATLELGSLDKEPGLATIARAREAWTADTPRRNHALALRRLDWRWRFRTLATTLGERSPRLDQECALIEERLTHDALGAAAPEPFPTRGT